MEPRRSLGWPILLGVVLIGSIIALGRGLGAREHRAPRSGSKNAAFYWAILGVGVALLVLVLVGVIVYLALTVKAIALSQRQSNFIDSVTHELKSPLASLKLYLQTLTRRPVPAGAAGRLPPLHAPGRRAARHAHRPPARRREDAAAAAGPRGATRRRSSRCSSGPATRRIQRHGVPAGTHPARSRGRRTAGRSPCAGREADLEIVFRNLARQRREVLAARSAGGGDGRAARPRAACSCGWPTTARAFRSPQRQQVFRRFVRLGSELERSTPGTGLGLFLVKSLVRQMRGAVRCGAASPRRARCSRWNCPPAADAVTRAGRRTPPPGRLARRPGMRSNPPHAHRPPRLLRRPPIDLVPIRRVLVSVFDKTGLDRLADGPRAAGVRVASTGGTATALASHGVDVEDVSAITGFPEVLDGRVKTLHPHIFAGILARGDRPDDLAVLAEHGIERFDAVIVNLYAFESVIAKPDCHASPGDRAHRHRRPEPRAGGGQEPRLHGGGDEPGAIRRSGRRDQPAAAPRSRNGGSSPPGAFEHTAALRRRDRPLDGPACRPRGRAAGTASPRPARRR